MSIYPYSHFDDVTNKLESNRIINNLDTIAASLGSVDWV